MPSVITAPTPKSIARPVDFGSAAQAGALLRLSVRDYDAMFEAGILTEESRVELLDGYIIEMLGAGSVHDYIVRRLTVLLVQRLASKHEVGTQSPIVIPSTSKPEPDLWVSRRPPLSHRDATVTAEDLLLVIEVGDSSTEYDRTIKLPLYAAAEIPEYWLIDVATQRLECYTEPDAATHSYASKRSYDVGQTMQHALMGSVALDALVGSPT